MDEIDFVYYCPVCQEGYMGAFPTHLSVYEKDCECEDCGESFKLKVILDLNISTKEL